MPEKKKRKTSTSRKGKKRTDVATHAEILPVKDLWEHTFDSMPDLIAILDDKHRIVRANKSMAQRLGVTTDSCVGLNCFKCVHKLDSPPSFCPHSLTIADGKEHIAEVHEDNLGGDFLVSTTPLFDQKGRVIGSVHVARDITQRKKAEEEIKSLSRFPSENPNVVMRISKDGSVLYCNDAGLSMLNEWNCQVGQLVPSRWRELVEDVFKSGMKKEFEEEHDTQTLLIMFSPVVDEGYVNVYGRDITGRKKAEEKLAEQAFMLANANDAIVAYDLGYSVTFWNKAAEKLYGYTEEEAFGKVSDVLFQPTYVGVSREALIERINTVGHIETESVRTTKDGRKLNVDAHVILLRNEKGEPIGYVSIDRDITERKKAEEELRKAQEELETRVQERTRELGEASNKLQAEIAERKKAYIEAKTRADQQAVVAQLGQLAVGGSDLNELFNETVKRVAQTLNVEYCKILELLPNEKELLLRAGVGWKEGLVGHATVGTGKDSQAGYTLLSDTPVVVEDLRTEKRFSGPPLLHEHKVVSGISVIVPNHGKPFGVLGAHTTKQRTFTSDDIIFLQAIANVLATTIEHIQAEEAVNAERKRFFDVLEKLPAYMVLLTPDYHVSYANRFFRERFGEDNGHRCFEYLFGRSEPCEICETYKALKNMAPLEWEWTGPDGHNYYIYDSPFTDVDGSTLIMEVGIDITERKKAEEELRKAHEELETRVEERTKELRQSAWELQAEIAERKKVEEDLLEARNYFQNLIDYANAPIIVWNPDYRITRFNHAFERLTGFKAEGVLGKPLEILFPQDSRDASLKHINQTASGEHWETVEIPILRTDGLVRTVLWNSANILGKDGTTVVATIAQGDDITERKQALESLRESQKDLNRAQAVAMTGSWRLDARDNILRWSDETYKMFGIPKGTPLSYETFLNFVHPDDREFVDDKWQAVIKGEPYDIEHRIIVNGKVKWVREKAELEFNKDGLFLGGFGTVQDVTEKREMHEKLEEYSRGLEQLVEQKTQELKEAQRLVTIGETAGMVGHDIRNPLQSIEGAVYLAREELKTLPNNSSEKKELYEILEMIRHQTNYIDHIVADLQDFSRTPMPQLRETNLHELVIEALSTTEISENIQIQTQIQDDLKTVTVDPVFIKRVFLNLIENAVHAMPKGGRLTIQAFKEDECTIIHVEDTGAGINEENKPKIFTPLFTTKSKGQGFGLAVCKKLIEAHNGEITFESETGKGTKFKIKLPQRKETM